MYHKAIHNHKDKCSKKQGHKLLHQKSRPSFPSAYMHGHSKPRHPQADRIEAGLRRFGQELTSLSVFC